jgi:hypothetical protein
MAQTLDDAELTASSELALGIHESFRQRLGPALLHLDNAYRRFANLGDEAMATRAQAWRARTLAALGDGVLGELILLQASAVRPEALTPMKRGERVFLEGEVSGFRGAWGDAGRHFQSAANRFENAGLLWRERLTRLRGLQAQARSPEGPEALTSAWIRLEGLKGPVEASGSRWLELEWHRAHALMLSLEGTGGDVLAQALLAWGEVLTGARELKFPALELEACAQSSRLLLGRGECLKARSRVQDASAAFRELWLEVPEAFGTSFLERRDIQAFKQVSEAAGLPFILPARVDPPPNWNLSPGPIPRAIP